MDNLADIIDKKRFAEPEETQIIKSFVMDKYSYDCSVSVQDHQIIIIVSNSALASNLRLDLEQLKSKLKTDKRIKIYTN